MKRFGFKCFLTCMCVIITSLIVSLLLAQDMGSHDELIKEAYQEILSSADKNNDGKLSLSECISISKNKNQIEKDCNYWDANGDKYITEDEYVKQVKGIMQ